MSEPTVEHCRYCGSGWICPDCDGLAMPAAAASRTAIGHEVALIGQVPDAKLKEWRALTDAASLWKAPWTAHTFEIDCPCPNENHCGESHTCEEVEALEEYPNGVPGKPADVGRGQCVVQIQVPGLETFAKPAAAFIAASRDAVPALLNGYEAMRLRAERAEAELAKLTAEDTEFSAAVAAHNEEVRKLTDAVLRKGLGPDGWNKLWGPYLEMLGDAVTPIVERAERAEADVRLLEASNEAKLEQWRSAERDLAQARALLGLASELVIEKEET